MIISTSTLRICLLLIALCNTYACIAQGNLQFGQVLFLELEGTNTSSGAALVDSLTIHISPGEVVKIESVSTSETRPFDNFPIIDTGTKVFLNDKPIIFPGNASTQYLPMWLPAGSYVFKLVGSSGVGSVAKAFVSAIEFNVIP